jgi:hypothetical protein
MFVPLLPNLFNIFSNSIFNYFFFRLPSVVLPLNLQRWLPQQAPASGRVWVWN